MRSPIHIIELDNDVGIKESSYTVPEGWTPPAVKYKKGSFIVFSSLWEGYTFKDTDAIKNWFGYYITGVPGVFVARIPQGSYSGTVKHSHKWGLFHEDSGYPLTNMVFKTRKAAWACMAQLAEFDWDRTREEIREDKDTVAMIVDRITRCRQYAY